MTAYGTEFFSMNDVKRLRIIQDIIDRRLTTRLAASRLEKSDRHYQRLLERYHEQGHFHLLEHFSWHVMDFLYPLLPTGLMFRLFLPLVIL